MEDNQREKERDRSRRGDRPSRFSDAARDRSNDRGDRESKRIIVSNIPYEYRWTELKDLFKDQVGDVAYVELFNDENGKPRGCGVVEFTTVEAKKKALFVMHRFELKGRKLVIKEETGNERRQNNQRSGGGGGGGGGRNHREEKDNWNKPREPEDFNTYGLSLAFLDSINVQPPLVKRIFVANLDYKADRAKIKEVFKMAGKVRNIDLAVDKDGNSRGFAVIEYDHPVEAVQAISMFDKQLLYDRRMTARMDRGSDKFEMRLPDGLKGIGVGLGANGEPLRDVARNLSQVSSQNNLSLAGAGTNLGAGVLGAVPTAAAGVALNGLGTSLAANTLGANTALGGGLSLQALGLTGLGALQNQLLQQGLTANDLATVLAAQSAANVNLNNAANTLSLANNDVLGSAGLGNNQLSNSLMGNNSMSSGPLSGSRGNMGGQMGGQMGNQMSNQMGHGVSMPAQGYNRDSNSQQSSREKPSDMVIIANLPPTVTWQLIREKFSECGDVKFAEMTAPDTAIVRFHKEWDAERAIKMFDRTRIDGRTIDVRYF